LNDKRNYKSNCRNRNENTDKYRYSSSGKERKKKIIQFDESVRSEDFFELLKDCDGHILKELKLINGAVILVDDEEYEKVRLTAKSRSGIIALEDDIVLKAKGENFFEIQTLDNETKLNCGMVPWNVIQINAHNLKNCGTNVNVAVLDTGIDCRHPLLRGKIKGKYVIKQPAGNTADDNGHGTHVAGIIAANRAKNAYGISPDVNLYNVKILDKNGEGNLSDMIDGIQWCLDNGIRLINLSLSTTEENNIFKCAMRNARRCGMIMVCATGNHGPDDDTIGYPAKFPETISVGATNKKCRVTEFSARGREIDVCAPGANIASTWPGSCCKTVSGTSMASPHVTAVIALMLEKDPLLSGSDVKAILKSTAHKISNEPFNSQGSGIIDAKKAIECVEKRVEINKSFGIV